MLFCPVLASSHFRIPSRPSPALPNSPYNSHGIISFTDPHPLTPIASILYKNHGGEGARPTGNARNGQDHVAHLPFLSTTCAMPICKSFLLIYIHLMGGVYYPHGSPSALRPLCPYTLSPFFSYSCALFCAHPNHNSFIFKRLHTLYAKHPGWGASC
jgi:hypothetical protein